MKLPKPVVPVICLLLLLHNKTMRAQLPVKVERSEQSRLMTRATMHGVDLIDVFSTYLFPQEYIGIGSRVSRKSMRMARWIDGKLSLQSFPQADPRYTYNKVDNNNTFSVLANWNYGLYYDIPIASSFGSPADGLTDLNSGFVYSLHNINNPASTRAYINLDASNMAAWDLRIKSYPLILRYRVNLPLVGVMFSPHYDQFYYKIFSPGNSDGAAKFTSLHNQLSLRQVLTANLPVGRAKMRFVYMRNAQQSNVSAIKIYTYSHVPMVSSMKEVYLLKNRKRGR